MSWKSDLFGVFMCDDRLRPVFALFVFESGEVNGASNPALKERVMQAINSESDTH